MSRSRYFKFIYNDIVIIGISRTVCCIDCIQVRIGQVLVKRFETACQKLEYIAVEDMEKATPKIETAIESLSSLAVMPATAIILAPAAEQFGDFTFVLLFNTQER
jgi:hypothetical protein